ncbi:MAG: hypothetical protein Q8880_11170 [Bacteroidota bacterium]|nr:hypothetical protein [Bacteroidota bacterium]
MSNNDISRISGNLTSKDKLGTSKEIENKRINHKASEASQKLSTPPADIKISEEGMKRLEASKKVHVDNDIDLNEVMKKISGSTQDLLKSHTGMSPSRVAELLKD